MPSRKVGVRVVDRRACKIGPHVHLRGDGWALTSHVPITEALLEQPLLEEVLPGSLGCYVYPSDVVYHEEERATTTRADLEARLTREREGTRDMHRATRVTKHVTMAPDGEAEADADRTDTGAPGGQEEEEEEEEEEDEEGEEEEEEERCDSGVEEEEGDEEEGEEEEGDEEEGDEEEKGDEVEEEETGKREKCKGVGTRSGKAAGGRRVKVRPGG